MKIMRKLLVIFAVLLPACTYVHVKPASLDKSETIHAQRGGYTMRYAAKRQLEERGFKVSVGTFKSGDTDNVIFETNDTLNARYVLRVQEREEWWLNPLCLITFQGFEWWRFNISIADQKTGEELLSWSGRGCANSNIRHLNRLIDELEK